MFGSSKSSALLEQRGIQDADPTENEKATGSQTPCSPTQGVWLKLSSDLETQWLGSRGQISSLRSQCYLGDRVGRETETGGGKSYRVPTMGWAALTGCYFFITSFNSHSQPPFKIGLINFLSIEETEARGAAVACLKAVEWWGAI